MRRILTGCLLALLPMLIVLQGPRTAAALGGQVAHAVASARRQAEAAPRAPVVCLADQALRAGAGSLAPPAPACAPRAR